MKRKLLRSCCAIVLLSFALSGLLIPTTGAAAERTELQIYSNPFGNATYVLSFALAEIVNKYSSKLHMTCLESKGTAANIIHLQQNPQALTKTLIMANPFAVTQAAKADPPFAKPYTGLKAVALIGNNAAFLLTTNKEIKTVQDLKGRKLGLGPKGITLAYVPRFVLKEGYGIFDELSRVSYMSFSSTKDAMVDGTLDVGLQSSILWGDEDKKEWAPIPATEELLATRACHLVDLDPAMVKKAREKSGYPIYTMEAKTKEFGISPAFGGNRIVWSNAWYVHQSMPDDIIQEVVSIIYEHADEFAKYHAVGKAISRKNLGRVAISPDDFHPAAAAFYRQKGLKVGE